MMKRFVLLLCMLMFVAALRAQDRTEIDNIDNVMLPDYGAIIVRTQMPFLFGGVCAKLFDNDLKFKSLRDDFIPEFSYSYDDYLQYFPAAVMFGLKTFGVEGRSSWKEMLVADAFSVALMAAAVNAMKYSIDVQRPDGSALNSFPSGHTATAFMCATMLHYEYGHISPWVSFGAYTTAATVGISRICNNRHWMSDVMIGAGIGVLSTQIGYIISDAIFKKKPKYDVYGFENRSSSFVNFNAGVVLPINKGKSIFGAGSSVGVEGAYFFEDTNFGIGMNAAVRNLPICDEFQENFDGDYNDALLNGGFFMAYPFMRCWELGCKVLCGANMSKGEFGFTTKAGVFSEYKVSANYSVKLSVDYDTMPVELRAGELHREHTLYINIGYQYNI